MFSVQSVIVNPLIATFQLSSAACLNLGQSQNGVLGNGSRTFCHFFYEYFLTLSKHKFINLSITLDAWKMLSVWTSIEIVIW